MTLQPFSSLPYHTDWPDFSTNFDRIFAVRTLPSVNEDFFEEDGSPTRYARYSPDALLYARDAIDEARQGGNSPTTSGESDGESDGESSGEPGPQYFSRRASAMPRSNAIFKFGPHYLDKRDNIEKRSIEVHKLVDLARYFILRNKEIFPYIIVRFESVKVREDYDFKLVVSNMQTRMKLVLNGADCLREFALYLLRYNKFLGIFNVFVPGFLFYKLRVVLQHYAPFLDFEFLASCTLKWRETFIFRNQFGVYFLVVLKLDYGCKTGRNWLDECYYSEDEGGNPIPLDSSQLIASASCLGGVAYVKFQQSWKLFSGVVDGFWNAAMTRVNPVHHILRFVIKAQLSMEIHQSARRVQIRLFGNPNSYCRVIPSTRGRGDLRDHVFFGGDGVFADCFKFLFLSSFLYDCDYIFFVRGLGLFNQIRRFVLLFPDLFGHVGELREERQKDVGTVFVFSVTTKSGRVHDFVDRDERMLCGRVYSQGWFGFLLRFSEGALEALQQERFPRPPEAKRPRLARSSKKDVCYAED